ncbi:MAG: glutamine synthetase [Rickettsiaceae bacterium]|nr:glutamine synthetase [Rickettsiaceae bacterium]
MVDKYNQLYILQQRFQEELGLTPIMGVELEFYLSADIDITKLSTVIGCDIEQERGFNQYEIQFLPQKNLVILAQLIENTRRNIIEYCASEGGWANFYSKPYINDFGSSMHIHINFLEDADIEKYANILCHALKNYIDYCLPSAADYERLDHKFMAPTHICWGGNNRSVMIRIPDSLPKRIEHRLPAASADPALLFHNLLNSIDQYLKKVEQLDILPKIYGNAFEEQYNLLKIYK